MIEKILNNGTRQILAQSLLNMVPITRTPWGGSRIAKIKALALSGGLAESIPRRIGESWEVSTGNPFPSRLRDHAMGFAAGDKLEVVLQKHPELLGRRVTAAVGNHCPLLLKWLHAQEVLSLQVHPALGDSRLAQDQEGKPESWLVMEVEPRAKLYLGFVEGLSRDEIVNAFHSGNEEKVLYSFTPEKHEYICVPPGCVHAIGAGVLLAEPQYTLPKKEGVTLRVSDWGRKYNSVGERDENGSPRETHLEKSLETIDWQLPRGEKLRQSLARVLANAERFEPPAPTPFPVQMWCESGDYFYRDLVEGCYSVVTVWAGSLVLSSGLDEVTLRAGESAFVAPNEQPLAVRLRPEASSNSVKSESLQGAAFFSLRI